MTEVQALIDMLRGILAVGGVVFLRTGAAAFMLPVFGERLVPLRVRLAGALALTVLVTPLAADRMPTEPPVWAWFLLTETIAGLALGGVLRLVAMALQIAGSMAAQATSLAQVFGGQAARPDARHRARDVPGRPVPAGGHRAACQAGGLFRPVLRSSSHRTTACALGFPGMGVQRSAMAFNLAFGLAAPFVVASVLYNLALGVINRPCHS